MGKMGYHRRCCVPNCYNVKHYNRHLKEGDNASHNYSFRLFKFPVKDLKRCKKWLKLIGRPEMDIKTSTRICSHHFTKEDYFADKNVLFEDCSVGRRCLKGTALPSKWLPDKEEEDIMGEVDGEEDEDEEPCLICSGSVEGGRKRKRRRYKFEGAENMKLLNEQLWSTFILREVLKVEEDKFGEILKLVGGSVQPGKWFVICEDCETSVVKILGWRKAIRKLKESIKEVEGDLKLKLEESLEGKEDENGGILNVRREIRKCFEVKDGLSVKMEGFAEQVEIKKEKECVEDKLDDKLNFDEDFNEDGLAEVSPELEEGMKEVEENEDKQGEESDNESDSSEEKPEVDKSLKRKPLKRKLKTGQAPKSKRKSKAKPKPSCDLCSYKAWSPSKMERHIIQHKLFDNSQDPSISPDQYYCNLCPISPSPSLFLTRRHLMRHKRISHASQLNLTIFQCPICPESFFYKANYSNHLFKNHPTHYHQKSADQSNDNLPQTYFCDKCNFSTLFKGQFTRHETYAHASVPFMCQYCSSTYKYSYSVQKHIQIFHPEHWTGPKNNTGDKPLIYSDNQLQKNIKKPRGKEFKCKYCPEGKSSQFPHKLALGLHLKETHKDLFSWNCNLCDKSYLRRQSLQTHLKINHLESGVKGKCEWCGKEVQHKTYLFSHWRTCQKRPVPDDAREGEQGTNC